MKMTKLIDVDSLMELARNHKDGKVDCNDIARFPTIDAPTVDAVPVVHGWIPVTERLPEVGKQVLTVDKWGHIRNRKLYAYMSGHLDFQPDGLKPGADIIYWADIPEPPEGWVYSTYSYPCYQRKPEPPKGECPMSEEKTMTNADRIRAMTDEELANWLAMGTVTGACINLGIAPAKCIGFCKQCIEEWFKQPAKG